MFKSAHFWKVWLPPHLMAAVGLWFYHDVWVLAMFLMFYTLISGLGVAVGFHRYFSHKAFAANKFWQQMMLYWGCMACQGGPIFWVALHRGLHHRYTDTEKDPHSPRYGLWRAYQGYSFDTKNLNVPISAAKDFLRHKEWMWAEKNYPRFLWSGWIIYGIGAYLFNAPEIFVGFVCAQTWAINQEAVINLLGHKNWLGAKQSWNEGMDDSVNRPFLAYITWGQSLHNNHHYRASEADFAFYKRRWYWFDPSMIWINLIRSKT